MKQITSASNPIIKRILHLQEKPRKRKEENVFIIDGWKETQLAISNGYEVEMILYRKGYGLSFDELSTENVIEISGDVFDKISYRGNTSKVVSLAKPKPNLLSELVLSENNLIIVLDGIEKPGNIGAILRVADAAGTDAVICCNTQTDIYNPNVIRSSVGCLFTKQIAVCSKEACHEFLSSRHINIFTTSLKSSRDYLESDYGQSTAFVVGAESTGVDRFWEENSTQNIIIPMRGQNDSLNVSNTVAIVLFEALRQRS